MYPKFTFREYHSQISYWAFYNTSGPWPLNFRNNKFLDIHNFRSQGCLKVVSQGKKNAALLLTSCDTAFHGTPVWQMGQSYVIIYSINIGCMKKNVVFFEIKKSITHIFPDSESNHYFPLDSLGWNPAYMYLSSQSCSCFWLPSSTSSSSFMLITKLHKALFPHWIKFFLIGSKHYSFWECAC